MGGVGGVGRWGDGEMGRWGDGEMERWGVKSATGVVSTGLSRFSRKPLHTAPPP
ncbi:MAG: hypothetical protein F6J90_01750 [Moorea sp. SIOASIH]|uniref:hypothetical protein n=1 Tax=Moorena sp. SIOASIH TaxID=2607817 RepID=UPI0013BC9D71|nr:hypothetical protein [Moorena sp. SIOASIH]NEO35093.1 hypothetical protein [Moorena sp. SIOASIH]